MPTLNQIFEKQRIILYQNECKAIYDKNAETILGNTDSEFFECP